jgi:1-acyl-sn-glycerol-3-phosphate acyltransferase
MMPSAMSATATSRNGHSSNPVGDGSLGSSEEESPEAESPGSLPGRLLKALAGQITSRVPPADLDERDPDYIRESLPGLWLLSSLYFRGEVRGLGNIPEEGPVLMVGNHSGGNVTPDTLVFTLAFSAFFGAERRFHQLVHNLVLAMPSPVPLRKYGSVAASHENSKLALRKGAALLVYPGGDYEVHRPSWDSARVDFNGRQGYIRLALEKNVPIVPLVSLGGQETALFLSRGERLARLFRLDKMFRLKVLPISLAVPWGLNVGDMLGHVPLPAKLQMRALEPIDIRKQFGRNPDVQEVDEYVLGTMQATLDSLAEERRFPVIG